MTILVMVLYADKKRRASRFCTSDSCVELEEYIKGPNRGNTGCFSGVTRSASLDHFTEPVQPDFLRGVDCSR